MSLIALVIAANAVAAVALPGGPPVGMDYLAFDAANHRLWVPAGNTGKVDVVDTATGKVTALDGFATRPSPRAGMAPMGPSSATVGEDVVWVGNRGDDKLCAFDRRTLASRGPCLALPSMPDGLQYVAATREVWVTTPRDQTLTLVDVKGAAPVVAARLALEGDPEGYALDGGTFYTNLEDKDRTLAVDVKTRKVVKRWPATCGAGGPRGLALDAARHWLFVACTDGARVLDLAQDGKVLGKLATGKGVDNIDYYAARKLLYVASRDDGTLTIAAVDDHGALRAAATVPTARGARNATLGADGTAYVPDSGNARLLVIQPPTR